MRDQIYSVGDLRAIIAPIAARHGVERIYLFGSYARGEATKNSDVDLRVDKGNLRGMFALGALYSDLEDSLGKDLDLLTTGSLDQRFLDQITGEEIVLYDRRQRRAVVILRSQNIFSKQAVQNAIFCRIK